MNAKRTLICFFYNWSIFWVGSFLRFLLKASIDTRSFGILTTRIGQNGRKFKIFKNKINA
jgi:hypothetical protein